MIPLILCDKTLRDLHFGDDTKKAEAKKLMEANVKIVEATQKRHKDGRKPNQA